MVVVLVMVVTVVLVLQIGSRSTNIPCSRGSNTN